MFVALRPGSPVQKELREVPAENIELISMRNAADVKSAVKISRFAERVRADIIHAHLARDYPGFRTSSPGMCSIRSKNFTNWFWAASRG